MPIFPALSRAFASRSQASAEGGASPNVGAAQSADPWEQSMSSPWPMAPSTALRFSLDAFLLPGRFTISVRFRIPATSLERQPLGVMRMLSARMASGIPGVARSITANVASGVTSRGEKPVPPVVSTRENCSSSAQWISSCRINSCSSGRIAVCVTWYPASSSIPTREGPLVSTRSPRGTLVADGNDCLRYTALLFLLSL